MITRSEKRRAVLIDLLIGIGLPIVQMATGVPLVPIRPRPGRLRRRDAEYVVSGHRYDIFEDFGPVFSIVLVPQAFYLYYAWPVAIGCVSLVYCGVYPGLSLPLGPVAHLTQC